MNLLIIDDEPLTVKSLKENMPWKELGIDEVYTAVETRFARQLITALPIHIILCDIEMPGESGIEFLRWLKESTTCDAITILLTCHDEFSYAREGISLNVMEYLLKPIAYDELGQYIRKAIRQYQEQRRQQQQIRDGQLWGQHKNMLARGFWQDYFSSNLYREEDAELSISGLTEQSFVLLLIFQISDTANALSSRNISLLLETQLKEIFTPFRMEGVLISPQKDLLYYVAYSSEDVSETVLQEVYPAIKNLLFSMQINQNHLIGCMETFSSIKDLHRKESLLLSYLQKMEESNGFFLLDPDQSVSMSIEQTMSDSLFQEVIEYVKRHLTDEITRQDVADAVHMNADYLSKVFKKKAGITLSEYIRQERLNYARHLLEHSEMNINEIATLLNFSSQSHFSSAFKKQYHCSPADYRNHNS